MWLNPRSRASGFSTDLKKDLTMNYEGNGITKYIIDNKLDDYFFSAKNSWLLLYGKKEGDIPVPRLLAFVCEVNDCYAYTAEQKKNLSDAIVISKELNLPLLAIRFKKNCNDVAVAEKGIPTRLITYSELKEKFQKEYNVIPEAEHGNKDINAYSSSSYHDWQRQALGGIVVTDLDLVKIDRLNEKIEKIFELKRSFKPLYEWEPYLADSMNFGLIINAIIASKKNIPFHLLYNRYTNDINGNRTDDISKISLFAFNVPLESGSFVSSKNVKHKRLCCLPPSSLIPIDRKTAGFPEGISR